MLEYLKASIVRCPAAIKLHGHIPKKKGRLLRNIVDLVLTPVGVIYGGLLYIRSRHSVEMHGKTAVVAIIKNEAPYIQEWIQYHILKGIDIFYIYDNDSDDNVEKVLKKYIEKKIVVYTKMPGFMRQCDAYNDALNRYGRDCQYMIFLDLDEFVYCEREYLPDVFEEKLKDPYAAALGINWC